ncbi:MAG: cyclophilin-like fold protein [Paenirhodobacter sp.]
MTRRAFTAGAACAAVSRPAHATPKGLPMRLLCRFADQAFTVALNDSPSAQDLLSLLPLALTIEDYAQNEKIASLPRKLTEEGAAPFGDEAVGDVCTYAPWGNLVFFHAPYRFSRGLIRLGRIEGDIAPLRLRGTYPLSVALHG